MQNNDRKYKANVHLSTHKHEGSYSGDADNATIVLDALTVLMGPSTW